MKRYSTCKTPACVPVTIPGTSQTIPGLAPDLQTLMAAAAEGEMLPRTSEPLFDESEEAGIARVGVRDLPPEEVMSAALELARSTKPDADAEQHDDTSAEQVVTDVPGEDA